MRLLMIPAGSGRWVWCTPDLEVQMGDLAVHRVVPLTRAAPLPVAVRGFRYQFDPLTPAEILQIRAEAQVLATVMGIAPAVVGGAERWIYGDVGYKGFGKDGWYCKGKGNEYGKGGRTLQLACFGCGATDHLLKDCPKNPNKIQQVQQEEEPEILFIGNVWDDWKHVPMKIGVPGRRDFHHRAPVASHNRFRVLEVDEKDNDDEVEDEEAAS